MSIIKNQELKVRRARKAENVEVASSDSRRRERREVVSPARRRERREVVSPARRNERRERRAAR